MDYKTSQDFPYTFLVLLGPAIYGNSHTQVYYNIDKSLPQTLDSAVANKKLNDEFNMNNVHMVLLKNGLGASEKKAMMNEIEQRGRLQNGAGA